MNGLEALELMLDFDKEVKVVMGSALGKAKKRSIQEESTCTIYITFLFACN